MSDETLRELRSEPIAFLDFVFLLYILIRRLWCLPDNFMENNLWLFKEKQGVSGIPYPPWLGYPGNAKYLHFYLRIYFWDLQQKIKIFEIFKNSTPIFVFHFEIFKKFSKFRFLFRFGRNFHWIFRYTVGYKILQLCRVL